MRRLLRLEATAEADVRPTLLGIVTLLFLLLFFLLSTSTGEKLASIELQAATGELAPLPHTGLVKSIALRVSGGAARLDFEVRTTDIAASSTAVEARALVVPALPDGRVDLAGLAAALQQIKDIDPARERLRLEPDDAVSVAELLRVLDVVHGPGGALFPKAELGDL